MKKEIVIEFERVRVIYRGRRQRPVWCAFCEAEVELMTLGEATQITGKGERDVFELIERGELHVYQSTGRKLLICLNSLFGAGSGWQVPLEGNDKNCI